MNTHDNHPVATVIKSSLTHHDLPRAENHDDFKALAGHMDADELPGFIVAEQVEFDVTHLGEYFSYTQPNEAQYIATPADKAVQIMHTDHRGVCACENDTIRMHRNLAESSVSAVVTLAHVVNEEGQRHAFERGTIISVVDDPEIGADIPQAKFYSGVQKPGESVIFRPRSPHQFVSKEEKRRSSLIQDIDR